jgi:uncharacterized OsmC-like protein
LRGQGDPEKLRRLVEKAEQFCVVRDTLVHGTQVISEISVNPAGEDSPGLPS